MFSKMWTRCFSMLFVATLSVPMQSCGMFENAAKAGAEAAKAWWLENKEEVINQTASAASSWWDENKVSILNAAANDAGKMFGQVPDMLRNFWDANKGKLLDVTKDIAKDMGESVLEEARAYTDEKLAAQREKTLKRLEANGISRAEVDTNGDGEVTDDELAAYLKGNPQALLYAGGAGGLFLLLWYAKQNMRRRDEEEAGAASPPAPPAAP